MFPAIWRSSSPYCRLGPREALRPFPLSTVHGERARVTSRRPISSARGDLRDSGGGDATPPFVRVVAITTSLRVTQCEMGSPAWWRCAASVQRYVQTLHAHSRGTARRLSVGAPGSSKSAEDEAFWKWMWSYLKRRGARRRAHQRSEEQIRINMGAV